MSKIARDWAWSVSLSPTRKLVLLALAERANEREGHSCFPSVQRIVLDTGMDRKTVYSSLSDLVSMGLITVEKGHGVVNRYTMSVGEPVPELGPVAVPETALVVVPETALVVVPETGPVPKLGPVPKTDTTSPKNGTPPVPKTVLDQSQKRDTNREGTGKEPGRNREERREALSGSRISADMTLPSDWSKFCRDERPDLDPKHVFECFKDYWLGISGKSGVKADWFATWRNWVRKEKKVFRSKAEKYDEPRDWI